MQNEMRDRLVELIKQAKQKTKNANCDLERNMLFADFLIENGVVVLDTDILSPENRPLITTISGMPLNEVIELIKAKQEGRIIVPPCKVGDTVYYIAGNKVYKSKCHAITLQPSMQIHLYDYDGDNARYSTKCVFPTPEEAEKALKEGADNR